MKDARPATEGNVTAADALRPFLREGEQIVWCTWERTPSKRQTVMRVSLLTTALTAAPLLGLLLTEFYRWYTIHEFRYPIYFMSFAMLLGFALTVALVHMESQPKAARIIAFTNRRVIAIIFHDIPITSKPSEPFDLEVLKEAMVWLNFDEIEEIDVFNPYGHISFKATGQARIHFGQIESLRDVMSLLPERVLSKLNKAERQKLENHAKARKAH